VAVRGQQPYSIFLSTEASQSERWAADELRQHIEQITGIRLRIDTGADVSASRRVIAIGASALTEKLGIQPPPGESCLLKTAGETVVIAGGRGRGTMYGVSIFLEKLGCRWFTSDVARIPRVAELWLPDLDETHVPAFEYREVFFTEAQGTEWSARNRLNGHFHRLDERVGGKITYLPFAHSYYDLVPPDRYFESHPEYFALVDGRRRGEHAQLCLTNPEVLRLAVAQTEQWLAAHPDVSIVSVSQNDGGGWCECAQCRQVIKEEGGAISGLALRFANQVAERLAVSHPGKLVDMLAYRETLDPPSMVRPLANVQIRFCPIDACQAHPYRTCVYNRRIRKQFEQWSRIAPKLHVWQYSINFSHYLAPFPNYDQLIAGIPMFHRAGVSGLFIEGAVSQGGGSDDAELRSYLAARLLWNPDLDARAEIRQFLETVYGPAAPLMWKYFLLRQQEVRRGQHLWIDQNVDAPYLTRDFLEQARALLARASQRAATDGARRRIEQHQLSISYVDVMRERRCFIQGAEYGPADADRVKSDTDKFLKTAETLGVTQLREGYPITRQASDLRDSLARYPAIVLNNGLATATVIPELEGRIIALGRPNILQVPDPGEWAYPRAGGICVHLYEGGRTAPQSIAWQVASAAQEAVTLSGKSDSARELRMQIGIEHDALRMLVTVSNAGDSPARVRLLFTAEFACGTARDALLTYRDRSGNDRKWKIRLDDSADGAANLTEADLPHDEWALTSEHPPVHISNRFQTEEVARCAFSWSFRSAAGLTVNMSLASPEVDLAPGQQLVLTSEFTVSSQRRLKRATI